MDPRQLFIDERLTGRCVHCGGQPSTRDHVPSKVFLDEPYPPDLPVADACEMCNASFSLDEQYLSCFIECVVWGTAEPVGLQRPKVKRILGDNSKLRYRIQSSKRLDVAGNLLWDLEIDRVRNVILKLARGHAAYELYAKAEDPAQVEFYPLLALSDQQRKDFEDIDSGELAGLPEIGSRAFFRASGSEPDTFGRWGSWVIVQPGRYRYAVDETGGVLVRIVLSEYLACKVCWE